MTNSNDTTIGPEEARQIYLDTVLGAWTDFCKQNPGSTDSRVGDVLADAVSRATAKAFPR